MTPLSQLLEEQKEKFVRFFWELEEYKDRKLGISGYLDFLTSCQQELLLSLKEEVERRKKNWSGGTPSQGYNEALSDILTFINEAVEEKQK